MLEITYPLTAPELRGEAWYERAIAGLLDALKENPSDLLLRAKLLHAQGLLLYQRGSLVAAVQKYKESLLLNPLYEDVNKSIAETKNAEGNALSQTQQYAKAAERYREALRLDPTNDVIAANFARVLQQASETGQRPFEGFIQYSHCLVGGTGWTRETYWRDLPVTATMQQQEAARKDLMAALQRGAIKPEEFMAVKDYDYLIGLGVSSRSWIDLPFRVFADELTSGRATALLQSDYDLLRNKEFDVLDCHSNGAMICLAALRNGDIRARKVRLFGPQVTIQAWNEWKTAQGVKQIEIIINKHDPVPSLSLFAGGVFPSGIAHAVSAMADDVMKRVLTSNDEAIKEFRSVPSVTVTVMECASEFIYSLDTCHAHFSYDKAVNPDKWKFLLQRH